MPSVELADIKILNLTDINTVINVITSPETQSQGPSTPQKQRKPPIPRSTRTRTRFFDAYDREHESRSTTAIAGDHGIDQTTAGRWLGPISLLNMVESLCTTMGGNDRQIYLRGDLSDLGYLTLGMNSCRHC